MTIRSATLEDLSEIVKIGSQCYSEEEAISETEYRERLMAYPHHFWILEESGEIVAFINGPAINEDHIEDELFHMPDFHREDGAYQAILGVNTAPKHQKKGYASTIMEQVIADAKAQGRRGCVLTCKLDLINYYKKFGFQNNGISKSVLAGHTWYDMILLF